MTAQFAKDPVSYFAPANVSAADAPTVFAPANDGPVAATLRGVRAWIANALQRRAVISELNSLSEHELADIGLTRADIPRVFDRAFIATRMAPRA